MEADPEPKPKPKMIKAEMAKTMRPPPESNPDSYDDPVERKRNENEYEFWDRIGRQRRYDERQLAELLSESRYRRKQEELEIADRAKGILWSPPYKMSHARRTILQNAIKRRKLRHRHRMISAALVSISKPATGQ
jgi:hypothetical protein